MNSNHRSPLLQVSLSVRSKDASSRDPAERLVTQPDHLAACVEELNEAKSFGLDTEFIGEASYHPRLCLIQVATADALFLIDPFTVGPLDAFWSAVVDPANLVIVHAGREEVRLCHLACGKSPSNLIDLQLAAGLAGLHYPLGHGPLVKEVLGITLSKGETLTEWAARPLTKSQIHYAFDDVRYLLSVWNRLSSRLEKLGRTEWVKEDVARLVAGSKPHTTADFGASEKWRKLRGVGGLDRRRLAIVRELFYWREETASKSNRPPRTIVRDDLLLEIARRGPVSEHDLSVIRGLAKRHLAAIVETVERGQSVPLQECPLPAERDQDPPQFALVVGTLMAVLGDLCARKQLAPSLVASTQDVKLLVRAEAQGAELPDDSMLTIGWRKKHILPELLAVLQGRRTVRIADLRSDAPLAYDDK